MIQFALLLPDVAKRETRTIEVYRALPASDPRHVPVDDYAFDELYCSERGCDCRRVMINVVARNACRHVATINHAFDKPVEGVLITEQTFLDPLNPQSPWASGLMDIFLKMVQADEAYAQRLVRHYRLFKSVVDDPDHPAQQLLRHLEAGNEPGRSKRSVPRRRRGRGKRSRRS